MADHLELIKALGQSHSATLAQDVVKKIQCAQRQAKDWQSDYLDRCREFGLLLRAHGLAQTLGHWHAQEKNCRREFAADLCEVLNLWLAPATPDGIRNELLPAYLLHSQIALEVADMFKRYGNALLDDLPKWTHDSDKKAEEADHA